MGAIHELREDYRHYRIANPQYRWLFFLAEFISFLIKLAIFAGFLFLCWYIVSRNPHQPAPVSVSTQAAPTAVTSVSAEESSAELTDQRIALLKEIAGRQNSSAETRELLGVVGAPAPDEAASSLVIEPIEDNVAQTVARGVVTQPYSPVAAPGVIEAAAGNGEFVTASFEQPSAAVVQVESRQSSPRFDYAEVDDIPTATDESYRDALATAEQSLEDIFVPPGKIESSSWVVQQDTTDFTVQVALTVNVEFLVRFARQLPDDHVVAIYPERKNSKGNLQYSLSLGSFPDKQSAEAMLASLPAKLKRYGAHTRQFDEIKRNTSAFTR